MWTFLLLISTSFANANTGRNNLLAWTSDTAAFLMRTGCRPGSDRCVSSQGAFHSAGLAPPSFGPVTRKLIEVRHHQGFSGTFDIRGGHKERGGSQRSREWGITGLSHVKVFPNPQITVWLSIEQQPSPGARRFPFCYSIISAHLIVSFCGCFRENHLRVFPRDPKLRQTGPSVCFIPKCNR